MIKDLTFLHFLTASVVIELFMMILFRFTKSSRAINNWYDNLGWTAVILDVLSICGLKYYQELKGKFGEK